MTRLVPIAESMNVEFKSDRGPHRGAGRVPAVVRLTNGRVDLVRRFVRQHGSIKRAEAAELCRIEPGQGTRPMARLVREKILVKQGERRGVEYVKGPRS